MMIDVALEYDEVVENVKRSGHRQEDDCISRTLEVQKKERDKCLTAFAELYPDWKNGEITREEYQRIRANLNEKIEKLDMMINHLEASQTELGGEGTASNGFAEHFIKHRNIKALTRPVIVELIDKILVHEGGKITIKVNFADAFESALDYLEQQKVM